jgi:cytoskeletal protein RodZ
MLDEFNIDEIPEEDEFPEEEEGNRTFMIAAGVIGGGIILLIACFAIYFFVFRGRNEDRTNANNTQVAANNATVEALDALTAEAGTQIAIEAAITDTPTATMVPSDTPTATLQPTTATSGDVTLAAPTTEVPSQPEQGPTSDPRTATVQALLTQAAVAQTQAAEAVLTVTPTPTQVLPDTGFIDDFGVPGLLAAASALVVVIFLVRRLRAANG